MEERKEDHVALECSFFATQLRQQERLCREEKGRKDSCWWAMRKCHTALDELEIAVATQLMVLGA